MVTKTKKRFKLWSIPSLHSHFLNILLIMVKTFMTSVGRAGGEILRFVTCLHILLFLNSRSIWGAWVGGGVVCGPHNCMILNIKTCFDKKVTLLAMVQQPSSLLYICTFKMKSNLGTKICAIANFYSGKYYRGKKTKKGAKSVHIWFVVVL